MWEANEGPNNYEQDHLQTKEDALAPISTSIVNTSIASPIRLDLASIHAEENQKVDEEL